MGLIRKVLIANRGEIAARIMRTCHKMGIATVAVFSDADERAPHVNLADQAVRIGPAPAAQSYLSIPALIRAAKITGADAVHPGYGFLAENAVFAAECKANGLIFIGPSAENIQQMGSKIEAKAVAVAAGVPIVPGYSGERQDDDFLVEKGLSVGFPLLVKASAGGGGKGMRIVREAPALRDALAAARREAKAAFGDDALMLERYIERPRHIELQILGDHHGNVVHLFERECSVQRRHQKIIEEAPSPVLHAEPGGELRARMGKAAVDLARAIGYRGAGTVEFLLGPGGEFYFLEVNTRLQVEHPVTEYVTGLDLVAWQIRVAQDEVLPFVQSEIQLRGASFECRIYAEDPARGFLPATGVLTDWYLPEAEHVRLDSGVVTGQEVTVHYDPMLAKLIAWGENRSDALRRMIRALENLSVQGVRTNQAFLLAVLRHKAFEAGDISTHFIEEHMEMGAEPENSLGLAQLRAAWAVLFVQHEQRRNAPRPVPSIEPGFRNNFYQFQSVELEFDGVFLEVLYRNLGQERMEVRCPSLGEELGASQEITKVRCEAPWLVLEDAQGLRHRFRVVHGDGRWDVWHQEGSVSAKELPRFVEPGSTQVEGACVAPMPGKVLQVHVEPGQEVARGTLLLILEAMKMEHSVQAPHDGVIEEVLVKAGQQVDVEEVLVVLANSETES